MFAQRCPYAEEKCWNVTPEKEQFEGDHYVECHRADEMDHLQQEAEKKETWEALRESSDEEVSHGPTQRPTPKGDANE
jgi:peptide/nickel transport system ATP-binding protein